MLYGVFYNNGVSQRYHVLVYVCNVNDSVASKPSGVEIAEIEYFDINDPPDGVDLGTKPRMWETIEHKEPCPVC